MAKIKDITGQRFGKVIVLYFSHSDKNNSYWVCQCDCGNIITSRGTNLRFGSTTSCGCSRRANLVGKRFGKLVVKEFCGTDRHGRSKWSCVCDCGEFCQTITRTLIDGSITSCGCIRRLELIGKRFGSWAVLDFVGVNKDQQSVWKCQCDCGKIHNVLGSSLTSGNSKSCGCNGLGEDEAAFNSVYYMYKKAADDRNIPFSLSKKDFRNLTIRNCNYCGVPPTTITKGKRGNYIHNGVDRVDNAKGYTLKNCVPCCKNCNYAKRIRDVDEYKSWIQQSYNHLFNSTH